MVSSPPSRSSAFTGGVPASPVTSLSPSRSSGCSTDGRQSTRGSPSPARRTTVSVLSYVSGFVVCSYDTVPFTAKVTESRAGAPGVRARSRTRASFTYEASAAFAATGSSVAAAASATWPDCQAVRNSPAAAVTSSAVSGPDFTVSAWEAESPPSRPAPSTSAYAP